MNRSEEKAQDLYNRFFDCDEDTPINDQGFMSVKLAKASALICVDEIIATLNSFADYWDLKRGEWYKDELVKIEKIKEEIQKL